MPAALFGGDGRPAVRSDGRGVVFSSRIVIVVMRGTCVKAKEAVQGVKVTVFAVSRVRTRVDQRFCRVVSVKSVMITDD